MYFKKYFFCLFCLFVRGSPEEKIINGSEVSPPFKFSWMAAIFMRGRAYCGGIFVASNSIITAAHCSKVGNNSDIQVLGHRHDLRKSSKDEDGFNFKVSKRIVHLEHDISLWHLEAQPDFHLTDMIHLGGPIKAGNDSMVLATALGWGWLRLGGPVSNSLQQVQVPLYEPIKCKYIWSKRGVKLDLDSQVCAGWPEGKKDTCKGDSGGPLFHTDSVGTAYLIGLTSFGEPCAKANVPTVYVKVSFFTSWISDNLNSYNATTDTNATTISGPLKPRRNQHRDFEISQ